MKILLFLCLLNFSAVSFAQQKPSSKSNTQKSSHKNDLLDIKSNEPNPKDLLDVSTSISQIKQPNSGQQIKEKIGLNGNFTFNKKIGFSFNSPDGDVVSYFYLNTKNGYSMQDWNAIKEMIKEKTEGEVTQIINANNDFYQYIKSSEGSFAMKMGSGQSMAAQDIATAKLSQEFFNTFKKTGNKVGKVGANKYPRVEYSGKFEGKKMTIWLSDSQDVLIDPKFTYSLNGFWGLGFIASPSGKTYMITGITGDGTSIFMNYMENANVNFSGKPYKPMGEMTGAAMSQNKTEMDGAMTQMYAEANAEKDPKIKKLKLKGIEVYKKILKNATESDIDFSQSSDINDIFASSANNENSAVGYFDIIIVSLDQAIVEHEAGLKEARENNDNSGIKRYSCLITCAKAEKVKQEKVKQEYRNILEQFKNDEEIKDEKINQLFANQGQIKSCECD